MMQRLGVILLLSSIGISTLAKEASQAPTDVISQQERKKYTAYIKPNEVLQQSEEFKDRKEQITNDIQRRGHEIERQAYAIYQEKQQLQQEAQDVQSGGKSKFTKEESRQRSISEIRDREAELKKQENNVEYDYQRLQEDGKAQEQELYNEMQKKMMQAAERVGQEQGWGAIDVASLYVAPSLDITNDVAEAMNKEYRERKASKQQATHTPESSEKQNQGNAQSGA